MPNGEISATTDRAVRRHSDVGRVQQRASRRAAVAGPEPRAVARDGPNGAVGRDRVEVLLRAQQRPVCRRGEPEPVVRAIGALDAPERTIRRQDGDRVAVPVGEGQRAVGQRGERSRRRSAGPAGRQSLQLPVRADAAQPVVAGDGEAARGKGCEAAEDPVRLAPEDRAQGDRDGPVRGSDSEAVDGCGLHSVRAGEQRPIGLCREQPDRPVATAVDDAGQHPDPAVEADQERVAQRVDGRDRAVAHRRERCVEGVRVADPHARRDRAVMRPGGPAAGQGEDAAAGGHLRRGRLGAQRERQGQQRRESQGQCSAS